MELLRIIRICLEYCERSYTLHARDDKNENGERGIDFIPSLAVE